MAGAVGDRLFAPAVAAARLGAGRKVAFGHDGFPHDPGMLQAGDTGAFLRNVFTWLVGGKAGARIGMIDISNPAETRRSAAVAGRLNRIFSGPKTTPDPIISRAEPRPAVTIISRSLRSPPPVFSPSTHAQEKSGLTWERTLRVIQPSRERVSAFASAPPANLKMTTSA